MIEFNGLMQIYSNFDRAADENNLNTYLFLNAKALAVDLSQNPSHAYVYESMNFDPIVIKIQLAAAILKTSIGDQFDLDRAEEICKLVGQLKETKQLTPALDKELSLQLARTLNLQYLMDLNEVRRRIHSLPDSHMKAMALAAWINYHTLLLKRSGLTPEERMIVAPYLHYVNLEGLDLAYPEAFISQFPNAYHLILETNNITELKVLPPFLQELKISSQTITSITLEGAPHLQRLLCHNCSFLQTIFLPDVPQLHYLYCANCELLTTLTLPNTPHLQHLDCSECKLLKELSLPIAPQLDKLACGKCASLMTLTLPNVPLLRELDCSYTLLMALTLPIAPQLRELDCRQSKALSSLSIPNALNLEEINCHGCKALTILSVPHAPQLHTLLCAECESLTTIEAEAFPNCRTIDCHNCPLYGLPQLPFTATVHFYRRSNAFNFYVNPNELDQNPLKVLLELGQRYLLANSPFPNIVWLDPLTRKPAAGIDAGGLRRQLVTTLCDNLFKEGSRFNFTDKLGGKLPLCTSRENAEEVLALRTFARLIALCSTSTLLLGEHLPHNFFYALRACLNQENEKKIYLTLLGLWDPEFSPEVNYANHREELENPLPATLPVMIVAEELKSVSNIDLLYQLHHDPLAFINSVMGKAITKETLLAKMQFEGMREYFERFMAENPHKLTDLVELFTACRTLGEQPITIKVYPARDPGQLPLIHTCSQEVEMPLYPSYESFAEKLNLAFSTLKTFENA